MHILWNIFQDRDVTGTSQATKSAQFLTPFAVQHTKNTLDARDGEVAIQSSDSIWNRFYFPDNPVDHIFHLCAFVGEGQTLLLTSSNDKATAS
jgi:hypothetical protein